MEGLPEALLGEIIKRLPMTSDLNSLSLVSKRLYAVEAELRDAIYVGCGVCPVTVALVSLCYRFQNLCKVEFNYSGWTPNHGMQLDNQGLYVFSSCCSTLTDLTLSFCSYIDDSGLGLLASFKKLMSLRLKVLPEITSAGLLSVAVGCKSLSALHLIYCKNAGGAEWLEYLDKFGSLEELVVENCQVSQLDLLKFGSGWMKLRKFEFHNRCLPRGFHFPSPSSMAEGQSRYDFCCDCVKDLTLARLTTEAEIGLCCLLRKCKALENLSLYYVLGVHDHDMITLAQNNRNLRSISLLLTPQHCEGYVYRTTLTDDSLNALARWCPMLQSVELTFFGCEPDWPEIGFTQKGLVMLIQSCPIRDLTLGGANIFNDKGMKALSRARFLESLKLVRCIAITDSGLHLLARSQSLISLTLELCHGLTDRGVAKFVRARKVELESLTIEKCSRISLKAVQGAAKTVHYTDDCPGFSDWVDRCVYGRKW
jgi:F-box/leucine-rich repeat protein 2/20